MSQLAWWDNAEIDVKDILCKGRDWIQVERDRAFLASSEGELWFLTSACISVRSNVCVTSPNE
jgi:hypothetical protein